MTEASMELADFMRLVLDALEAAGVEYMIGGAVAVWAWGDWPPTWPVLAHFHRIRPTSRLWQT